MIQPFEMLETAVSRNPHTVGLIGENHQYSFLQMWERSKALASNFHGQGVKPRQVVSTFLPPDLDWLTTLAVFHEAAVPLSLWGVGLVDNLNVSWFVGTDFHKSVPPQKTIIVDGVSVHSDSRDQTNHQRVLFARPDKPMRYVMTSGTTGAPKAVTFTGSNIQARLDQLHGYWADRRPELNFMGLSTTGGFFTALASLEHGYPYMAERAVNLSALERAKEHKVQVLAGSPAQIGQALMLFRDHKLRLPDLVEVRLAGSQPSEKLVSAIHAELGVKVKSVYGSTEGGGVAVTFLEPGDHISDAGEVIPGIELEIRTEDGASGKIRYRGPGVSTGYLEGSGADSSFVDGWFYPGDSGHISENGHLVVEGRDDEILNVGGIKINAANVEEFAKKFDGVIDAAVCLVERVPGIEEVAVAVVGVKGLDLRGLDRVLRANFPIGYPTIFTTFQQIPRNRMGKTVQDELRDQILRDLKLR
jgi:long-chain acyl-CoA synthetase